jgi:hypothetical protein
MLLMTCRRPASQAKRLIRLAVASFQPKRTRITILREPSRVHQSIIHQRVTAISGGYFRTLGAFTGGKKFALEHERFKREFISVCTQPRPDCCETLLDFQKYHQKTYSRKRLQRTCSTGLLQETYSRKYSRKRPPENTPGNVLHKSSFRTVVQETYSRKTCFSNRTCQVTSSHRMGILLQQEKRPLMWNMEQRSTSRHLLKMMIFHQQI